MANNQDSGYVKVEDTLPGQQSAKGQQDVSWPMESQQKAVRTLGSFANPQSKESTSVPEPVQRQSKESPDIQAPLPQSKEGAAVGDIPLPLSKDSASVVTPVHGSKDSPDVATPSEPMRKHGSQVEDRVTDARKDSPTVAETEPRSKSQQTVSTPSGHASKSSDEVSPEPTPLVSKDSEVVNVNGVYRDKDGNPVAIFKDHLKKSEDTVSVDDDHQKKKSAEVKPKSDQEKKDAPINTNVPHGRKNAINIDASAAAWSKKEAGEDIGGEIVGEPDQYKGEIVPELNGQSISQIDKLAKTEIATGDTEPLSKEEIELERLASHGNKSESEIDANKKHLEKKQYSYDELLALYIKQVETEQTNKKATAQYSTTIGDKQTKAFSEASHVDFSKVPQLSKSAQATEEYSTSLADDRSKTFNDVLPTAIPLHTKNPKVYPEGTAENDIPSVVGFDADGPIGADNFMVSMSDRTTAKIDDDVSDNAVAVEGVQSTAITAPASSFDDRNYFKRTSGKIADRGAEITTYDSSDPKKLSTNADDMVYSEVRNAPDSQYKPVYDWTDLIPPRIGLASILKTATQTFGLTKYVAFPQIKPEFGEPVLGMDWLRFGQRALTGEVARYVFSRLQSSVLYGFNADKAKQRLEKPAELSASGVLDQADKVFDLLNPVVNFITADPADLFKNQEELDFRGLLKGMGNQIDRTASGMFSSMGNYYNAVRAKITNRFAGYEQNLAAIDTKISKLKERIASMDSNPATKDDYNSHKSQFHDRYEPSQHDYDNYALENLEKRRNTYEENVRKLGVQYASILINLDSPSEYKKYINPDFAVEKQVNQDNTWSVSMKRSKEGPDLHKTTNSHWAQPDKKENSFDWREFNFNRKPNSQDDFDEDKGYLFFSQTGTLLNSIKDDCYKALGENPIYDDEEKRKRVVNDMFDFKYLLVGYNTSASGGFIRAIKEIYDNGQKEKGKETSVYVNIAPSKEMASLYFKASNPDQTSVSYKYYDTGAKKDVTNNDGESLPNFGDPHLTSLLERQIVKPLDVRGSFVDAIKTSSNNTLKAAADQIYFLNQRSDATEDNYVNLATINFDTNKAYYSQVSQNTENIKGGEANIDELRRNRSVLYQATLNYLAGNKSLDQRKFRDNILKIVDNKNDSKLPFGSGMGKNSSFFVFNWFKNVGDTTTKTADKADINDILPDASTILNGKSNVSSYTTYNSSSKKIIDGLYQRRMAIVPSEFTNDPDVAIKSQVDNILARDTKKQIIPIGMSMVSSSVADNIKAVTILADDPNDATAPKMLETKYVAQSVQSVDGRTESITESTNPKAFTFKTISDSNSPDGYSLQRNTDDNTYYKAIKTKREALDKQNPWNMALIVSKEGFGSVSIKDTNLGGILVSASVGMDKVKEGTGNLYFEIPFQFNPEISGESRSANWNSVTAFGRTHEHFIYSNTGARSVQFKTTYAITDCLDADEAFDKFGTAMTTSDNANGIKIERNEMMDWAKGWTENYILMIMNMYRSLVLPINAYSAVTPPVITIDFGKMFGNYTRVNTSFTNARWVVSEYSIDSNLDAGYTQTKTPRLFDVTLSLKEVYNGWHDAQDFYVINKHLKDWADNGITTKESWQA